MLRKLLLKNTNTLQMAGAVLGASIGLFLLLLAVQFYFDAKQLLENKEDLFQPEFIVINKPISIFNTFSQKKATFTQSELKEIEEQSFVNDITPFLSNQFKVSASTKNNSNFPAFYTDLFFEAIPGRFLDIPSDKWNWQHGDREIPIVLPRDYLTLYNFGFAQSQGLPQVSGNLINKVAFNVKISGNGKTETFRGRIVAFTDRVNTILVPYNFLKWANQRFGDPYASTLPSRIVLVTENPSDPQIYDFITQQGYETNLEKLKSSKVRLILKIVVLVIGIIAITIIILSWLIFMISFQLIISKNQEKIKNLILLGFHYLSMTKIYALYMTILLLIANTVAFILFYFAQIEINQLFHNMGFEISFDIRTMVVLLGFILSILILIVNTLLIAFQIKKLHY